MEYFIYAKNKNKIILMIYDIQLLFVVSLYIKTREHLKKNKIRFMYKMEINTDSVKIVLYENII